MYKIEINDSNLVLCKTTFNKGEKEFYLDPEVKSKMLYQEIYYMSPGTGSVKLFSTYGQVGKISTCSEFEESWIILKSDKKEVGRKYDQHELDIVRLVLLLIARKHIGTAELLCRVIPGAQNIFYGNYGSELFMKLSKPIKKPARKENFVLMYQRTKRYGVYEFLKDLVSVGSAKILVDSFLLGKYVKISRGRKPSDIKFKEDSWSEVSEIGINRSRANINLVYQSFVEVDIPENPYGVESGKKDFKVYRSMCIIRDGSLHTKYLAVKDIPNHLAGKLRGLGAIVDDLMCPNEYLVDLTKLPLAGRSYMRRLSLSEVFVPDIKKKLYHIAQIYVSNKISYVSSGKLLRETLSDHPMISDAERWLNSLGIYGDIYKKPGSEEADKVDHVYYASTFRKICSGIPTDYYPSIAKFIKTGSCKNQVLNKLFTKIEKEISKGTSLKDLEDSYKSKSEQYACAVGEVNLRMILNKGLILDNSCALDSSGYCGSILTIDGVKVNVKMEFKREKITV